MKVFMKFVFGTAIATFVAGMTSAENTGALRHWKKKKQSTIEKTIDDGLCLGLIRGTQYEDHHSAMKPVCQKSDGTIVEINDKSASDELMEKFKNGQFKSGEMDIEGCIFQVNKKGETVCGVPKNKKLFLKNRNPKHRNLAIVTGNKSVLVVKVIANDASTSASKEELSNAVFGNNGDPVNLKSQFGACSNNQLIITEATERGFAEGVTTSSTDTSISQGAVAVTVDISTNAGSSAMVNEVESKLEENFGVDSAATLADHIMFCLPPGTMSGIAYAFLNSHASVYSDNWCKSVSAQMHEIGHNINLGHSGEGSNQYADQTGMMGFSYWNDDFPKMCFNPAKSWQLDWYSDKATTLSNSGDNFIGDLGGIADYATSTNKVLVKLSTSSTNGDYFIGFNAQRGANSQSQEAPNQVTVVRANTPGYSQSSLIAKLGIGGTYDMTDGTDASIVVDSIDIQSGTASVKICVGPCPAATPAPVTPAPVTLAPVATLAPVTPAPITLAPIATPSPVTPAPITLAPVATSAPVTSAPVTLAPVATPSPVTSAPVTLAPVATPPPVTSAPVTLAPAATPPPVTTAPVTLAPVATPPPVTSAPVTLSPVATPPPVTSAPVTLSPVATPPPVTTAPVTLAPVATPPPVTSAPVTLSPVATPPPVTSAPVTLAPVATPPPVTFAPVTLAPVATPAPVTPAPVGSPPSGDYDYKGFLNPLDKGGIYKSIKELPGCSQFRWRKIRNKRFRMKIFDSGALVSDLGDGNAPRIVKLIRHGEIKNIFEGNNKKSNVSATAVTIPVQGGIMKYSKKEGDWRYTMRLPKKTNVKRGCYIVEIEVPLSNGVSSSETVYGEILLWS